MNRGPLLSLMRWALCLARRLARRIGRSRRLDEACRRNARAAEALDAAVKEMLRQ